VFVVRCEGDHLLDALLVLLLEEAIANQLYKPRLNLLLDRSVGCLLKVLGILNQVYPQLFA
jgi:hypothetical protein